MAPNGTIKAEVRPQKHACSETKAAWISSLSYQTFVFLWVWKFTPLSIEILAANVGLQPCPIKTCCLVLKPFNSGVILYYKADFGWVTS